MYGLTTTCSASNLVIVDVATGATTDLGALSGIDCGIDLAYNTNDDMIYIVDLVTDSLFKVDPATLAVTTVGSLGVAANYAQGMDFEEDSGVLYWAAYTSSGELRIIDTTTGASTLVVPSLAALRSTHWHLPLAVSLMYHGCLKILSAAPCRLRVRSKWMSLSIRLA
jgi:hypothetical protein